MLSKTFYLIGIPLIAASFGSEEVEPTKIKVNQNLLSQIDKQWDKGHFKDWQRFNMAGLKINAKDSHGAALSLGLKRADEILEKESVVWGPNNSIAKLRTELDERLKRLNVLEQIANPKNGIVDFSWPHQKFPIYHLHETNLPPKEQNLMTSRQVCIDDFLKVLNKTPKGKKLEKLLDQKRVQKDIDQLTEALAIALILKNSK